jgi:hypothetical protein
MTLKRRLPAVAISINVNGATGIGFPSRTPLNSRKSINPVWFSRLVISGLWAILFLIFENFETSSQSSKDRFLWCSESDEARTKSHTNSNRLLKINPMALSRTAWSLVNSYAHTHKIASIWPKVIINPPTTSPCRFSSSGVTRHDSAALTSAFRAHSGFGNPDFLIARWILSASFAAILMANNTLLAVPFGSFGLPIFVFIYFVNI